MRAKLDAHGLTDWQVDSAGTGAWHVGERPDSRSMAVARAHGLDISHQRARQFKAHDLQQFDLVLAMDRANYRDILAQASPDLSSRVRLMLEAAYPDGAPADVPDPYWDDNGFEQVYQLLDEACDQLLARILSGAEHFRR